MKMADPPRSGLIIKSTFQSEPADIDRSTALTRLSSCTGEGLIECQTEGAYGGSACTSWRVLIFLLPRSSFRMAQRRVARLRS
jgi:hypothetical protein